MADSDSPLYSPASPTTKQASSLHKECRQVLQELQRVAEADKTTQETMKECIAEFARCQVKKETLVKRVEDLLDRAQYYKTLASSIHGDEVQLYGEYSCDEAD
ncbi:glycoside hydrolase family 16 protein [Tulasnella calospora MUT 4182]|uniref:Glycoside hydrolase family 16 protein n=1 Tax=Tulasnella calospora MUT 4182 TaxID=1051891 RepID=A0A0C3Q3S8_9AGAM|nr:glycoside hydrolase family 16 protein [Tulasnella calospora MUT 4182]